MSQVGQNEHLRRAGVAAYHSPMISTFTDVRNEPADDLFTTRGMRDLWMKLNSIERFVVVRDGSIWG